VQTVGDYVTHVSSQLNDQRYGRAFTRWGRGLLLDYMNLGLAEIGTYRPEAFAKHVVVALQPGSLQTIDWKTDIQAIYSNVGGPRVTTMDESMADAFAQYDAAPPDVPFKNGAPQYVVRTYYVNKNNAKVFTVDPPVPYGVTASVHVIVQGQTPKYALTDWDSTLEVNSNYINNVIDFMLAKAYEIDTESTSAKQHSLELFTRFYQVLGVNYKRYAQFRSGYYAGLPGTGEPRPQ
jgi:hypothetical protein